jgi:hypothetical protein
MSLSASDRCMRLRKAGDPYGALHDLWCAVASATDVASQVRGFITDGEEAQKTASNLVSSETKPGLRWKDPAHPPLSLRR